MQIFTLVTIAACVAGAAADLHAYAWCTDRGFEGINEIATDNSDATKAACARYKARNTGTKQWDTCPDCLTGYRGDGLVCNSPAKHIGGDEWNYYCVQVGADYGSAS